MSNLDSPTYRAIYETQNENHSVSGVAIKINCENHSIDNSINNSSNLTTSELQCPLPSSSAQSSSSLENNQNKPLIHKPQLNNLNNALDDDIIELPDVEYPIIEPIAIRGNES